jgi:signal transduction histidine kinase
MTLLTIALLLGLLAMSFFWWREREARAEADAALLEQVEKRGAMRRSLEHLSEGVVLLGARNEVRYANPAAATLLGAHRPPAHGTVRPLLSEFAKMVHVVSLVDRTDAAETVRRVVESRDGGRRRALSLTLAPAGGSRRLLILEDAGADAAIARQRRDFVANASHELKTPIAALIGLLELMDQVPEEARPDMLERCRRNARSLANMTEDLLGLARAEDPDWRPAPRPTDVAAISSSVVDDYRESAEAKDLTLEFEADVMEQHLLDADCYTTVLRNLVANAVNYTQRGRVTVRLSGLPDGRIQVEVEDTGPGIDAAALPSIFERFYRGDPARSRATGGTGLGLAIVRNLLRRMGGRISVTSREGEGTTFRIELPANPARPLLGAGQPEFH